MEQGSILKSLYFRIMNEEFDYGVFKSRLKLQKLIYLLEEMGISLGGYGFSWYKHGPYSQSLQEDAYCSQSYTSTGIQFNTHVETSIETLKNIINEPVSGYDTADWLETLASIRYLKKVYSYNDAKVIEELPKMKSHLDSAQNNERALSIINNLFA